MSKVVSRVEFLLRKWAKILQKPPEKKDFPSNPDKVELNYNDRPNRNN